MSSPMGSNSLRAPMKLATYQSVIFHEGGKMVMQNGLGGSSSTRRENAGCSETVEGGTQPWYLAASFASG
eukprot:438420-Prymnesium_polylepis.1